MVNQSFDFSSKSASDDNNLGDLYLEINSLWMNGVAKIDLSATDFDSLTTAPSSIVSLNAMSLINGQTYVFITNEGYYGKMKITNITDDFAGNHTITFKFAVQTDLTKNLST